MRSDAHCGKHTRTVQVVPPKWAPYVLEWVAVREFLTGCLCADPDPSHFDAVWQEIREHLRELDEDQAVAGQVSFAARIVHGFPLSAWLDPDILERILRGVPIRDLLDPDDPRNPGP